MKRLQIITVALFVLFAMACNTSKQATDTSRFDPDPEAERAELVGKTWTIARLDGKEITAPEGRTKPYLTFTADGSVSGSTGCNNVNGNYQLEKGLRLSFDQMATTLALCPDVTYERDFLDALNKTDNYTLVDGVLSFSKGRMTPFAVFMVTDDSEQASVETARQELIGTTWTLDRLFGNKPTIPSDRTAPTLTFTADGKVHGNAGCNTLNGSYTLQDGLRLKFEQVAVTRMLCQDVNYENAFLEALNTTDNYTVVNGVLSLNKARMAPLAVLKKVN